MRLYDQNIWGNFSADNQYVANRTELVRDLIFELKPDFCCFQECNPNTVRAGEKGIAGLLKPCYIEVLPEFSHKNYTPVFYNPKKVTLIEASYTPFEGLNDLNSKSATWGIFEDNATKKRICIMSVHFWWMAEGEKDNIQRKKNAESVSEIVKGLYEKYKAPVLIAGDLNSGDTRQGMGGYDRMCELGMSDVRYIAKNTDMSKTCSSEYPFYENGVYTKGIIPNQTIDYIFAYKKEYLVAERFSVINTDKSRRSSDHLPLIFDFDVITGEKSYE